MAANPSLDVAGMDVAGVETAARTIVAQPSGSTLAAVVVLATAAAVAVAAYIVIIWVLKRINHRFGGVASKSLVRRISAPLGLLLPILALQIALPGVRISDRLSEVLTHVLSIAMIAGCTWLVVRITRVAEDVVGVRFPIDVPDNRRARRMHTLVRISRRIGVVIIIVIGAAVALMTFPQARQLGASVLASAGIAGLVIGMAARPALSNIIAGVQIALTEPIAIDDVVIVQGEFGRVEEITTAYVVVRVWDLRRIIVPLSHFIEHPFQNWTRVTADLLGTVFVHTDFTVPVPAVREELTRILESEPKWDRKVNVVHVTDATNGRVELRLLMSAIGAGELWDLRCSVRERIVDWLQRTYPEALARTRIELHSPPGEIGPGPAAVDPRG